MPERPGKPRREDHREGDADGDGDQHRDEEDGEHAVVEHRLRLRRRRPRFDHQVVEGGLRDDQDPDGDDRDRYESYGDRDERDSRGETAKSTHDFYAAAR